METVKEKLAKLIQQVRFVESDCYLMPNTSDSIAEHLVQNGVTIQEWVSVDERLPEDCGMPVLMVAVNCYDQRVVVKGFTDYQCPIRFLTNEKEYDHIWSAWEVTHWMPLPEPPKGVQ